jgi:signal transduction histidine kinase
VGKDPLRRAAILALVAGVGVASEIVAHSGITWGALDLAVGLCGAAGGAFLFAAAWFVGTLVGGGSYLVLLYRAPLLQLLMGIARPQVQRYRAAVGLVYVAALLPFRLASVATVVAALAVAVILVDAGRRATDASRGAARAGSAVAVLLAVAWALGRAGAFSGSFALVLVDVVTLLALIVATTTGVWAREAERALVVDLGPTRHAGPPLTRRIARSLADPVLEIRYRLPDGEWVNEQGDEVAAPGPSALTTRAPAPGGGEVALLHGATTALPARFARAAAAAAALSLESARLDAEVRARAREVDESRRRLLTAADDERRALEERLSDDVLGRLRRVDRLLACGDFESERRELRGAIRELIALARGLYPPALARHDLAGALRELARRSPVPVTVDAADELEPLPESHRAAAWFLCSEALVNVARHAGASSAQIVARRSLRELEIQVSDNGRGGASFDRGLQGLADRIDALGGRLVLTSPPGGPTVLHAELPLTPPPERIRLIDLSGRAAQ